MNSYKIKQGMRGSRFFPPGSDSLNCTKINNDFMTSFKGLHCFIIKVYRWQK